MIDVKFLKCEGQKLRSIQIFVILTKLVMQLLSVTRILRQHHEIWSGSGIDKLLQFLIALMNSTVEKLATLIKVKCMLISQFSTELKVW